MTALVRGLFCQQTLILAAKAAWDRGSPDESGGAARRPRRIGDRLFVYNRHRHLDIGYPGNSDHRARNLDGELVLSLEISFCGV